MNCHSFINALLKWYRTTLHVLTHSHFRQSFVCKLSSHRLRPGLKINFYFFFLDLNFFVLFSSWPHSFPSSCVVSLTLQNDIKRPVWKEEERRTRPWTVSRRTTPLPFRGSNWLRYTAFLFLIILLLFLLMCSGSHLFKVSFSATHIWLCFCAFGAQSAYFLSGALRSVT